MKPTPLARRGLHRRRRGSALLITLAFVLLLTGVVLAFLARTTSEQMLSRSSATSAKADNLSLSALQIITADLKQEIVNGSTKQGSVYYPSQPAYFLPTRDDASATPKVPNLVRISSQNNLSPAPPSLASASLSTDPAAYGRKITPARWNRHYLIPLAPNAGNDTTPSSDFTVPSWVYVSTNGPARITSVAADGSGVIGRYAYAIFDVGGLLDVNVAGYPTTNGTAVPAQAGSKFNAAAADLTTLGLTRDQINTLVGWRNYASAQPAGSLAATYTFDAASVNRYFTAISTNTNGFVTVADVQHNNATDQAFVSRRSLIDFWKQNNFPTNTLQYFTTFSRETNAPSWRPLSDATEFAGNAPAKYNYRSNSNDETQINPDITRVTFRNDKTLTTYTLGGKANTISVKGGSPLVRERFNLQRIKWLTPDGPDVNVPNSAAAIKLYFGLAWDGTERCWQYTSPTGTARAQKIKTLDEVAQDNREPDFFELLQAGILFGSLGKDAGPVGSTNINGTAADTQAWDQTSAYQILQIGANIIDQYDSDSYPTDILTSIPPVTDAHVYGIENLPYLSRVYFGGYYEQGNSTKAVGLMIPEVWNPHQRPATNSTATPQQFRFVATGSAHMRLYMLNNLPPDFNTPKQDSFPKLPDHNSTEEYLETNPGVTFTVGTASPSLVNPIEPVLLTQQNASSTKSENIVTSISGTNIQYAGSYDKGTVTTKTNNFASNTAVGIFYGSVKLNPAEKNSWFNQIQLVPTGVNFFLQYLAPDGTWRTYTQWKKLANTIGGSMFTDIYNPYAKDGFIFGTKADPRTDRFNLSIAFQDNSNKIGYPNMTIWTGMATTTSSGAPELINYYVPSTSSIIMDGLTSYNINNTYGPATLSVNNNDDQFKTMKRVRYLDPDNVPRRADGAYAKLTSKAGLPLFTSNLPSRPIVLDRPFRSVAEIGYALRDMPWKTLNFFTPESADLALLDLFTVGEGEKVAGKVNLNTRQLPVLKALLRGTSIVETNGSITTSLALDNDTTIATLATALADSAHDKPFENRAELAARFCSPAETVFQNNRKVLDLGSDDANRIKTRREAIVRSLADASNTRTWNFLIDVIAQTGKFPPGATRFDQFMVDGERHYWLHLAIDRVTGEVVDRILEPVYE